MASSESLDRDGRPLAADQLRDIAVAEPQRNNRSLRGDPAEAVGEMPEEHEQAELKVLEAVDGDIKRERV